MCMIFRYRAGQVEGPRPIVSLPSAICNVTSMFDSTRKRDLYIGIHVDRDGYGDKGRVKCRNMSI